jgi:pimeloyl-ACP methyl ester carboxylesterase
VGELFRTPDERFEDLPGYDFEPHWHDAGGLRPGAAEMRGVADELSRWEKPALVAFSDSDPVFPYPRAGDVLCRLIPGAGEQVRIEHAAHFLQEDRGELIAELTVEFVRS